MVLNAVDFLMDSWSWGTDSCREREQEVGPSGEGILEEEPKMVGKGCVECIVCQMWAMYRTLKVQAVETGSWQTVYTITWKKFS